MPRHVSFRLSIHQSNTSGKINLSRCTFYLLSCSISIVYASCYSASGADRDASACFVILVFRMEASISRDYL